MQLLYLGLLAVATIAMYVVTILYCGEHANQQQRARHMQMLYCNIYSASQSELRLRYVLLHPADVHRRADHHNSWSKQCMPHYANGHFNSAMRHSLSDRLCNYHLYPDRHVEL